MLPGLRGQRFNGTLPVMKALVTLAFFLAAAAFAQTSEKRPFTFEDMMALKRVGAPVPSPDGKWVVFDCEDVDLEANTKISHLWIVPASGGESRRLNQTPNHEERPRFSPDGKRLDLDLESDRSDTNLDVRFRPRKRAAGWRAASGHDISTGADGGDLVARRKEHRVRFGGLSRLQGRCVQQTAR